VASPKYPGPHSRIKGQVFDRRTFGDHLGILGLISAFGSMHGEVTGVDLISGQHAPPEFVQMDLLAATRSSLIKRIRERLPAGVFEEKQRPFWALVKGTATRHDFLLDEDGVTIEDAGAYRSVCLRHVRPAAKVRNRAELKPISLLTDSEFLDAIKSIRRDCRLC
jgi:hypothetical protein